MNTKVKAMNAANAQTWVRARKLIEHVEGTRTNQARGFLSEHKTGPYPQLLDGEKLDKRSPTVRRMLKEFQTYSKNHKGRKPSNGEAQRPSQGNPEQTPRAGAPTLRPMTPKEIASLQIKTIDGPSLIKIKRLSDELGGIDNLEDGLRLLKALTR